MPGIDDWLGSTAILDDWFDSDRGVDTARVIAEKPTNISIIRRGAVLEAQQVRLEPMGAASYFTNLPGTIAESISTMVVMIGYKGHPSIADTDAKRGDRFYYGEQQYEIQTAMTSLTDRLLCLCGATE